MAGSRWPPSQTGWPHPTPQWAASCACARFASIGAATYFVVVQRSAATARTHFQVAAWACVSSAGTLESPGEQQPLGRCVTGRGKAAPATAHRTACETEHLHSRSSGRPRLPRPLLLGWCRAAGARQRWSGDWSDLRPIRLRLRSGGLEQRIPRRGRRGRAGSPFLAHRRGGGCRDARGRVTCAFQPHFEAVRACCCGYRPLRARVGASSGWPRTRTHCSPFGC